MVTWLTAIDIWASRVHSMRQRNIPLLSGVVLTIVVAVLAVIVGSYHFTHHGKVSGVIEPIAAILLFTSVYLVARAVTMSGHDADSPTNLTRATFKLAS